VDWWAVGPLLYGPGLLNGVFRCVRCGCAWRSTGTCPGAPCGPVAPPHHHLFHSHPTPQVITFEAADAGDGLDAELDAADFDTTEFINRRFPTEASLEGLDVYLARTDREVKHLDEAISEVQPPSPLVCTHLSSLWGACVRAAWGAGGEEVGRGGKRWEEVEECEASCCCFVCFFGCSSHSALLLGAVKGRGEE
jgi:hypothetical protein